MALIPPTSAQGALSMGQSKRIWYAKVGDSFQIQLSRVLNAKIAAKIYDIDLFGTPLKQIESLHRESRKVVCYFSAGSSENWLDIRSASVRKVMQARMDLAVRKGCDGIDPDNVDGYSNSTGFALTAKEQFSYNLFLARQAHARGLAVGLKNDIAQVGVLATSFEFAVNEQCHEFNECAGYRAFTTLGKPVLNIEYQDRYVKNTDGAGVALCNTSRSEELYTLMLPLSLMGTFRISCDGK